MNEPLFSITVSLGSLGTSSVITEKHYEDIEELPHLVGMFKRSLLSMGYTEGIIHDYIKKGGTMKVTREEGFKPITIVLETKEDYEMVFRAIGECGDEKYSSERYTFYKQLQAAYK